ncbi:MAG: hypothetical protein GF331_24360 [Chitinivibrionales bacterium]|nr:hypothetical protein [Chitinivibrionales bacterium]
MQATARIGETAGRVWQLLNTKGALSVSQLPKELNEKAPLVHQALGWLAREGKIEYTVEGKKTIVKLVGQ